MDRLLAPFSCELFKKDILFREPFAAPFVGQELAGVLGWDLIFEILNSNHDNCWLAERGVLTAASNATPGRVSGRGALIGFSNGQTLVVRKAQNAHAQLRPLADEFETAFNSTVDIQLFCTPGGCEGFGWHYDIEEVFIIQSQGEKEFSLRRHRESPLIDKSIPKKFDFAGNSVGPEIRCLLKAGDFLYIPAGFWHKAHARTDSFHFSIGVLPRTTVPVGNPL